MNLKENLNIQSLLWLALGLALVGSLKHLAFIFSSIDGNIPMGLLQALAIDTGLFALSFSLRGKKESGRPVYWTWVGISIFCLISIYGNLSYGYVATNGSMPVWLATIKPFVLAASLPLLVLYLSEMVSSDRQHISEKEQLERQLAHFATKHTPKGTADWFVLRRLIWLRDGKCCADCNKDLSTESYDCHHVIPEFEGGEGRPDNLITVCRPCHKKRHKGDPDIASTSQLLVDANETRAELKKQRMSELASLKNERPGASITELATLLDVSRGTVRNYLTELASENGNWEETHD